jgi:ketosteroid isomerase-like protein
LRTPTQTARAIHEAYVKQDRAAAERLIAADLVFTSPQDDHIDRAAYFTRCFPTADRFVANELGAVSEVEPGVVMITYSYELADGTGRFSNVELLSIADGQIHQIRVYFGGLER